MFRSFLIGVTLLGLLHSAAVAQTCTGLASYSEDPSSWPDTGRW